MANIQTRDTAAPAHESNADTELRQVATPWVDIFENDEELLLMADLPGVRGEELDISLDRATLTIGAAARPREYKGKAVVEEFTLPTWRRTFQITAEIDPDGVRAEFKNGVLWVHLPKASGMKTRRIPVSSGA